MREYPAKRALLKTDWPGDPVVEAHEQGQRTNRVDLHHAWHWTADRHDLVVAV